MKSQISTCFAQPNDLDAAQRFYDSCGYGGTAIEQRDTVLLVWHQYAVVGIVRLCPEDGFLCLRGMQIHSDFRRAGLGSRMLLDLELALHPLPCFCLPYRYLEGFYGQAGFSRAEPGQLPRVLQDRLSSYLQQGIDVIAMFRSPGHVTHTADERSSF